MTHALSLSVFIAFKGTNFHISLDCKFYLIGIFSNIGDIFICHNKHNLIASFYTIILRKGPTITSAIQSLDDYIMVKVPHE